MNEKGIEDPRNVEVDKTSTFYRWLLNLYNAFPKVQTFSSALTPTAVSASSESVQTFTVTGLTVNDAVIVNKPTNQINLDLVGAWVSAANTLSIKYRNHSGGSITPAAETYRIIGIRL